VRACARVCLCVCVCMCVCVCVCVCVSIYLYMHAPTSAPHHVEGGVFRVKIGAHARGHAADKI